jgi:hypothetical protein
MAMPLEQAKAARNAAHNAFETQVTQVQEDLAARGIGGRIADRAGEAMADAAEVANENKGVVAGTIAAIILWALRGPIVRIVSDLWDDEDEETERKKET